MIQNNIKRKEELQKLTNSVVRMRRELDIVHNALQQLIDKEIHDLENEDEYWNKQAEMQNE